MYKFSILCENIKIAFNSIRNQSLRTILTILIIAIGVTALVSILSVISALRNTLEDNFLTFGANTFWISRYNFISQTQDVNNKKKVNPTITYREAQIFKEKMNNPLTEVSLYVTLTNSEEIKYANDKTEPIVTVLGVDENYLGNAGLKIEKGRNFSPLEINNHIDVCIIGSDLTKKLFKKKSPIGKIISLRGRKITVIGVIKNQGSTFGNNQDMRILIPNKVASSIYSVASTNYNISVRVNDRNFLDNSIDKAILMMRNIRKLSPHIQNNFAIGRSDDLLNRISQITSAIAVVGTVIGVITIFGSSVALLNIMLVSVTERTKEIGLRKALGAKRKYIIFQFLTETFIIALLGGITGIVLGITLGFTISTIINFNFVIPWQAIIFAIIISFVVTIFSGLYPSLKASRLDPVEALRYE